MLPTGATETLIGRILGRFGVTWLDFPSGATEDEISAVVEQAKAKGQKVDDKRYYRFQLNLTKVGGRWLLNDLQFVS